MDDVEILKAKLIIVTEDVVGQSKRFSDEDHQRQCKKLEGKIEELKKTISNMRQVNSYHPVNTLTHAIIFINIFIYLFSTMLSSIKESFINSTNLLL